MNTPNPTIPYNLTKSTISNKAIEGYLQRVYHITWYPLTTLNTQIELSNIIDINMWSPLFFDYTDPIFAELPIRDTQYMQRWTMGVLEKSGKKWWIAWYLEDRSLRLRWTHLIDEGRIYHLGIDIIAPANTPILSPLDGEVIESTIEPWKANYGGYTIIRYTVWDENLYVLYGHLDPTSLAPVWGIKMGRAVWNIWSPEVNGDWTTHLHMQALTEAWLKDWKSKWYCSLADIPTIRNYCPDPSFLLRY